MEGTGEHDNYQVEKWLQSVVTLSARRYVAGTDFSLRRRVSRVTVSKSRLPKIRTFDSCRPLQIPILRSPELTKNKKAGRGVEVSAFEPPTVSDNAGSSRPMGLCNFLFDKKPFLAVVLDSYGMRRKDGQPLQFPLQGQWDGTRGWT